MARLASQAKMEYYPTPEKEIEKSLAEIQIAGITVPVRALDPCSGDGRALRIIEDKLKAEIYGVELDTARSMQTARVTGKENCLSETDALTDARITAQAFNLIFNNPPYDWERGYGDRRLELTFIERYASPLVENGIMILVIPKALFEYDQRAIELLKVIFKNYAILNREVMTEDTQFGQWIITLRKVKTLPFSVISERLNDYATWKKIERHVNNDEYLEFWDFAIAISEDLRPKIDHKDYSLSAEPKPLKVFQSVAITEEMLEKALSANNKTVTMALEDIKPQDTIETLLPLRNSHLPLLLPTGHLNGRIEGTNLVINGQVERFIEVYELEEEKYDKNGKNKTVTVNKELNKFRAKLSVLDLRTKETVEIN